MASRIIYLNPFPNSEITGGIKMMFRHVEMLSAMGFDASIYSPDGYPDWMPSSARLFGGTADPTLDSTNTIVFPEVLNGSIGSLACRQMAAKKVLLCQNQYYMFNDTIPKYTLTELLLRRH